MKRTALCLSLFAVGCGSPLSPDRAPVKIEDDRALVVEDMEIQFDSIRTDCHADTVVVNGQVRFICP